MSERNDGVDMDTRAARLGAATDALTDPDPAWAIERVQVELPEFVRRALDMERGRDQARAALQTSMARTERQRSELARLNREGDKLREQRDHWRRENSEQMERARDFQEERDEERRARDSLCRSFDRQTFALKQHLSDARVEAKRLRERVRDLEGERDELRGLVKKCLIEIHRAGVPQTDDDGTPLSLEEQIAWLRERAAPAGHATHCPNCGCFLEETNA